MKVQNKKYDYYDHQKVNNFYELLELITNKNSNNIAFSYKDDNVLIQKSYIDFYNDVVYMSNYLHKNFKNKHIGIISENCYNYIVLFFSIILSGNICVLFDKDIEENMLKSLLKKSDTKILFYSENYCSFVSNIKIESYNIADILNDSLICDEKSVIELFKNVNNDDAVIFFTSGTTGANKPVILTEKCIVSDIYGASSLFKLNGKVVSFLPYHHAFGLITSVLKPYYYGKEVFINGSLKYLMNDIKEIKPETLFVVPAFIEMFYKQIWKKARFCNKSNKLEKTLKLNLKLKRINIDFSKIMFKNVILEFGGNLKYIICGGAYLDTKYIEFFRNFGIEILNGYGITECSPVVSVNRNHYHKDGSVGIPCKDVVIKIIDNEICVSGEIIMKGYYKDAKSTDKVLIDNYFHTGDLGYIDSDGFLYITGRKKNTIILSNGENISPEEVERELLKNKEIREVIIVSENNKIIAYIYPSDEYIADQEYFDDLMYRYNKNKPKNHQIAYAELRTIPFIKNSNGKILRDKVKE